MTNQHPYSIQNGNEEVNALYPAEETSKPFYGITIGPIFDTLQLSSKPAALWAGSYMFSELSYLLCKRISDDSGLFLLTPQFDEEDDVGVYWVPSHRDGIGLFPDHIIFTAESDSEFIKMGRDERIEKINEWRTGAIGELAKRFTVKNEESDALRVYLSSYLQVHIFEFEVALGSDDVWSNPILASQKTFDCVELEYGFAVIEERNELLDKFENNDREVSKSSEIKKLIGGTNDKGLITDRGELLSQDTASGGGPSYSLCRTWPLWDANSGSSKDEKVIIRDLEDISHDNKTEGERLKKHRYYAVIRADGDNMSETIKKKGRSINQDSSADNGATDSFSFPGIVEFSETCWNYSRKAAKVVSDYHGVTIYSGGDDLLALVPVENSNGKNVLDLTTDLQEVFAKAFGTPTEGNNAPTLSIGICICYYKYPLYEALDKSYEMLFGKAKQASGKNTLAIYLEKHSGSFIEMQFRQQSTSKLLKKLREQLRKQNEKPKDSACDFYNGSITRLGHYHALYVEALKESNGDAERVRHVFENTFDDQMAEQGTQSKKHLDDLLSLLGSLINEQNDPSLGYTESSENLVSQNTTRELTADDCRNIFRRLETLMRFKKFFVEKAGNDE